MKTATKKRTVVGLSAACALMLSIGTGFVIKNNTVASAAEPATSAATSFFHDYLLDNEGNEYTLAKKFYKAFEEMKNTDDFKDGVVDYRIDDIVTSDQLKAWVENGDLTVPRAFSAARDAFLTDHPEIFYIDFYKMTISVAKSGGTYVGYVNSGREANLYYDNGFNTKQDVNEAVRKFEKRIDEVVTYVNQKEEQYNTYVARDVYLAKEVNTYLAENIKYDYVSYQNKNDPNYIAAAYINTPYGGLVEQKAVCGGFSTAYKVIMDRLGIPCITVNGYSNNRDEYGFNTNSSVYHMWNYVWLETPAAQGKSRAAASKGEWYSVDVTWNSASYSRTRYAVMNEYTDSEYHVADGEISSSGYRLRYPKLSPYAYGSTGETDGLQFSLTYESSGNKDDFDNDLVNTYVIVSYNGKSAKRLYEEDGLYLVIRNSYYESVDGTLQFTWTNWYSLEVWRQCVIKENASTESDFEKVYQDSGTQTRYYENTSVYGIQVAVFDYKPDRAAPEFIHGKPTNLPPDLGHDPETESHFFYYYSNDKVEEKVNAVSVSDIMINESYGTYAPAPYVNVDADANYNTSITFSDSMGTNKGDGKMNPKNAFVLSVTYDQDLHILDKSKPIGISFTSVHPNTQKYAFFERFEDGAFVHLLDDNRTLQYKFCPSLLYEHNDEIYSIFFTNVGSARKVMRKMPDGSLKEETLDKLPNNAVAHFSRAVLACPARFNYDGRLWVDCCAQPELVSNSDLSAMNFLDENGESTFSENQRSQMMLVAEKADTSTVDAMKDAITANDKINVNGDNIISSETYDIALQMCGKYPTIPEGSYVKIALGFPEGYSPENLEGVTFKIFHRKHIKDDIYEIEEIPCVVTQFGIVAVVTSFSPYMVAVVDEEFATEKTVYASIEGKGGKLSLEDGKIKSVAEGGNCTYTIQPEEGYQVYSVTLNGKNVADRIDENGKLTLSYEELSANSHLIIQYIADAAAARIQEKLNSNVIDEAVTPDSTKHVVAVKDQPVYSNEPIVVDLGNGTPASSDAPNLTVIIVVSVICGVLVIGAICTVALVLKRKKNKA